MKTTSTIVQKQLGIFDDCTVYFDKLSTLKKEVKITIKAVSIVVSIFAVLI